MTSRGVREAEAVRLEQGLSLLRAGRHFDAHEVFEELWRGALATDRDLYQGLVHISVAWYQAGRGNRVGCERQLGKAARRLAPYKGAQTRVPVAQLLAQVHSAVATVDEGSLDLAPIQLGGPCGGQ